MNQPKPTVSAQFEAPPGNVGSYVIGFVSCLALTLIAYLVAVSDAISDRAAIILVSCLAVIQCIVQLQRFLHLGSEFKPRWKLLVFCFMLAVVLIFVFGSLWIMSNLNYRMMRSPDQMNHYIKSQDGL